MAYTPNTWTDGTTVIAQSKLENMENGIANNADSIDTLNSALTGLDILTAAGTSIPNNSDLNDYTTPGKYYCAGASQAATMVNAPQTSNGFTLFVFKQANAYLYQVMFRNNESINLYLRYWNSTWKSWRLVTTTAV